MKTTSFTVITENRWSNNLNPFSQSPPTADLRHHSDLLHRNAAGDELLQSEVRRHPNLVRMGHARSMLGDVQILQFLYHPIILINVVVSSIYYIMNIIVFVVLL